MEGGKDPKLICRQYRTRVDDLQKFISLNERLGSFESSEFKYPHNSKKLNPSTLAKAGFIRGSAQFSEEPEYDLISNIPLTITVEDEHDDAVFCPFCFKHLSEFEPDDQPFQEHRDHKPSCVFINQVASVRSRTSQWMDPVNPKPVKSKQKIVVGDLQEMHDTISKAHWEYIENYQKSLLQQESAASPQVWLLNNIKRRKKSGNKDALKQAFAGKFFTTLATKTQSVAESPRIDPRSIPKNCALFKTPVLELTKVLKDVNENRHNLASSTQKPAPLRGISANFSEFKSFSPANAIFPKNSLSGKENQYRQATPMARKPEGGNDSYGSHNQTISVTPKQVPAASSVAEKVLMSPGTPTVGDTKTMYLSTGIGNRMIPVKVTVDETNIQGLKRLSKLN